MDNMQALELANKARLETAMNRSRYTIDGMPYSVTTLLGAGRIAYLRQDKDGSWGMILSERLKKIESADEPTFPRSLWYVPFREVPKSIAEFLYKSVGVSVLRKREGEFFIEEFPKW